MTEKENSGGALAGWRVVDLSRVLGGPLCTQILGDHGADVIKVEPPQGDETRTWGPPFQDGESAYYTGINRNKRSIGLDLSRPEGRDIVLRLLEGADVLIENFRIGTMERWGLGYKEVLEAKFPALIYCRISGFGADGPLGALPGYDGVAQALSGLMSVNGTPESGPVRVGVAAVDLSTALNATIAILAAAAERSRSGRGQFVEATLYDTGISLLHPQITNWFMSNKPPQLVGNAHPSVTPYDRFRNQDSARLRRGAQRAAVRPACAASSARRSSAMMRASPATPIGWPTARRCTNGSSRCSPKPMVRPCSAPCSRAACRRPRSTMCRPRSPTPTPATGKWWWSSTATAVPVFL